YFHTQFSRFIQLRPRALARKHIVRFLADAARGLATEFVDALLDRFTGVVLQRAGDHDGLAVERPGSAARRAFLLLHGEAMRTQALDQGAVLVRLEEIVNALGHHLADLVYFLQLLD